MISPNAAKVAEFHRAFGHPVESEITLPDVKTRLLRFRLLFEEVMEFGRAVGIDELAELPEEEFSARVKEAAATFTINDNYPVDIIEAADALADIEYVTHGAGLVFGFPSQEVFDAVQDSNMSKLGADGQPILAEDGKVVKGPGYFPPTGLIRSILAAAVAS